MGRGFLVAVAVAALFIFFAAAAVDRGTPSSPPPTPSQDIGDAARATTAETPQDPAPGKAPAPVPPADAAGGSVELLIFLQPGTDPAAYARNHGLVHLQTLRSDPNGHVFAAPDGPQARAHLGRSKTDLRVRRSYLNERLQRVKCAFVPNDPFYTNGNPAGFPGQWHLGNGAVPGVNIKVPAAWARDITGTGVVVGIVDDGLEIAHPDLQPNYVAGESHDFGQGDGDPSPVNGGMNEDRHGTSVAGVAAARGGNGIGGTGAAPLAGLAGLRIDFANQTTAMFVDATKYHSDTAGAAIKVKNHSYGYTAPYVESQAERDAVTDSADPLGNGTAGTVHLFAAGNERGKTGEDSNKQDVQSSPHVIAVAAFGSDGKFASYSSFGANVFVTTPSSSATGFGITTTDRVGSNGYNRRTNSSDGDAFPNIDYTSEFGGTSSATPLATGVMALVKQVQPNLSVRFAKHLLVRTSQLCDPNDSTATGGGDGTTAGSAWKANAVGFKFNQNYGFGLIDADALTQQALLYTGVTPVEQSTFAASPGVAIPDNNLTGTSQTFSFSSPPSTPLEEVLLTVNITHTYRGDVELFLTSPSGTQSRLAYRSGGDSLQNVNWTFVTNAFWGETAVGTWTLMVRDVFSTDVGTLNSFSVTARMGQLIVNTTPPAVSSIVRAGTDPTNAASVNYTVTFTKSVTGVNAADFTLAATGTIAGASVTNVTGSGSIYTVTVNTGTGNGTLRLDLVDDDSIQDAVANKLGGTGAGNGNFSAGQFYTIEKTAPTVSSIVRAAADPTNAASVTYTVTFSESVSGVNSADFVLVPTGTIAGASVTNVTGGPAVYTVTVNTGTGSGTLRLDLVDDDSIQDAVTNKLGGTGVGNGNFNGQFYTIDKTVPTVVQVRSTTPDGIYALGAVINVTVDFSEAVTLAGGTLQVTLSTGDVVTINAFASQTSVSGSYTVGVGDTSPDLNSNSPLTLSGGTLRDAAGNNCTLTIPVGQRLADLNNLVIDTVAPTVTITQAGSDPTNSSPIPFTVTFSEAVTGFDASDVTLSGTAGATTAVVTGGPSIYTVTVSGMTSNGTVTASIGAGAATDIAGNPSAAPGASDNTVTVDTAAPTVTILQAAGQADPTSASPILFTVTFNEPVQNFQNGDVTLGGTAGATTAVVTGGPSVYTVTVSGMTSQGTVIASIGAGVANDLAQNANLASTTTDNQVVYDATRPTVTINKASGQSDPANVGPILFTVVFSEPVTGFDNGDVTIGGTAGATTAIVSGTGTTYTVSVSGMTGNGTVTASIAANVAADGLGNLNFASTSTDNSVDYNPGVPTVTINQAGGQADPTDVSPIVFDVVFSEAVNGFATGDVTLGGTAGATTATVSGSGATYTVTVTGMTSSGQVVVSIPSGAATSVATGTGNAPSTSADNTVTFDNAAPTVTINQAGGQADPTNVASVQFSVTFSENVTGFANNDISFTGSTVGGTLAASVSGSGASYTVTVTGMTGTGNVVVSIPAGAAVDALNHPSIASTSADNTVAYDGVAPTVTINQAGGQADPTNGSIVFAVTFSESVDNFTTGDVSFAGSTVGGTLVGTVTGSGASYTVTVTGMTGTGTVVASIPANRANDPAGNVNVASTSGDNSVAYDGVVPTVTINKAVGQADPTNVASIQFTVTFSEAVSGFAGNDISFTGSTVGGSLSAAVTGSGATYTVTVTGMTGTGTVVASIPAGRASDPAGNVNSASTSTDNVVAYDGVAPTVTLEQAAGQTDPTNGSAVVFTVVFSESVSNFATGDVTLGGTAGATAATVTGSGTTYTVTVTGMTTSGTVLASLATGVASDGAGNPSAASTSIDNTVTVDITVPTVTINQAAGQADPTNGSPILFTAVFSEPVTGFISSDVIVGGTAGGTAVVTGGPTTYTISVSGMSGDGTVAVTIPANAAVDSSNNNNLASTSTDNTVTFDGSAPVVSQVTSTTANGIYGSGAVLAISVLFSEPVVVTGTPQLTLETGPADAVVNFTGGSGTSVLLFVYTVGAGQFSTDLDVVSTLALSLNGGTIRDAAGNNATLTLPAPGAAGSLSAAKDLIVDTTPPVAGTVNDGWAAPDVDAQLSVTTLSANWSGFSDPESGITGYEWAIGTTAGGQQILPFTPVELQTTASTSALDLALPLSTGSTFFVTVRATNGAGLTVTATSDGVTVTGSATTVSPPAGLFAVPDDQAVLLDWLPSPTATVSFYRVWYKPSASTWSQAVRVDPLLGLSAVIPGLTNGTPYTFMIKAVDASENESWGVYASATPQASITIGGLGSYGSPQAAIDDAVPGETVVLGPGTYSGALTLHPGISLQGTSPVHTIITGTILVEGTFPVDPKSTISNLTITGGTIGVFAGTADVQLDHVIIHHVSSHGASSAAAGRLRAVNCTVMSNGGDGLRALGPAEVRNCIVGKNLGMGLNVAVGALVTYGNVYGNGISDYPAGIVGTGNVTAPATFLDEAANNYIEDASSTTVDTGDPADAFSKELSPNGGRINQGAFGNTRWAASKATSPAPAGGRRKGGGGCGLTGLDGVALLALLSLLKRRRR